MKIKVFRKQCVFSLIGLVVALLIDFVFIVNHEWLILFLNLPLLLCLILIIIGYYQEIEFTKDRINVIENFRVKKTLPYNEIAQVYIVTILLKTNKKSKWICLCEKGKEYDRINYHELNLPIKKDSMIGFKYSSDRLLIVGKFLSNTKEITVNNQTGEKVNSI